MNIPFVSQSLARQNRGDILEKIACFTGHREIPVEDREKLKMALRDAVIRLINDGFTEFRAGGALGFDIMAEETVIELKKEFPQIKLIIYVPCLDQNKNFSQSQNERYLNCINAADKILCISRDYYSGCMLKRNREMVKGAAACVCYKRRESGGTAYTVRFAQENGLEIIHL